MGNNVFYEHASLSQFVILIVHIIVVEYSRHIFAHVKCKHAHIHVKIKSILKNITEILQDARKECYMVRNSFMMKQYMNVENAFTPIHGVHHGLILQQHEHIDELNDRLASRQFSDQPLQPYFDPRPTPTKYAHFPIIERRAPTHVPIVATPVHDPTTNFNPATRKYHVSTYLANVNNENELRGQTQKLQRGGCDNMFVPSSNSNMYIPNWSVFGKGTGENDEHPFLFQTHQYQTTTPSIVRNGVVGNQMLFNNTRVQLMDVKK